MYTKNSGSRMRISILDMLSTCPKTLIKTRNIRWFSFCTERASAAMIWMWQCATDI